METDFAEIARAIFGQVVGQDNARATHLRPDDKDSQQPAAFGYLLGR